MILIEDKNNVVGKHKVKNAYWQSQGIEVIRHPLPVGDYVIVNPTMQDMLDRKAKRGIEPKKMDFLGTYDVCVDSKFKINEIEQNLCGKSHERFRDEAILAMNNGIKLYILVENESFRLKGGVESPFISKVDDLHLWRNPRAWVWRNGKQVYPKATKGITLQKICKTFEKKYGCEFIFCTPRDSGAKIIELLGGNTDV